MADGVIARTWAAVMKRWRIVVSGSGGDWGSDRNPTSEIHVSAGARPGRGYSDPASGGCDTAGVDGSGDAHNHVVHNGQTGPGADGPQYSTPPTRSARTTLNGGSRLQKPCFRNAHVLSAFHSGSAVSCRPYSTCAPAQDRPYQSSRYCVTHAHRKDTNRRIQRGTIGIPQDSF